MSRPSLRPGLVALLTCLGALACSAPAFATHEQGGSITASVTADGHLKGKVHYLSAGSCTVGTPTGAYPISVKSPLGTTAALETTTATYTRCVPGSTTQTAPFDIDLATAFDGTAPDGVWQVNFSSCCRVSGIRNVSSPSTSFTASVRKVTGQATHAPVLDSNVATGIAVGYEYAQNLNASDADGGTLTYQSRAGQSDGPNTDVVTYSADGWVRIPASLTATFSNGWTFVYKVRVVDSQGDYAERDVLLRTTNNNKPPVIADPGAIAVAPGATTTVNLSASDPNNASPKIDTVALSAAGLPSWASLTATPGNPATATLTLSPPADTADGVVGVNIDAIDNDAIAPLMTTAHFDIAIGTSPDTTLVTGPSPLSGSDAATFTFTADLSGTTFECQLDGGSFTTCASPLTLTGLDEGSHTFEVRAVKGALADATPAVQTFTVDTVGPDAPTFGTTPDAIDHASAFTFTAAEAGGTMQCRFDGAAFADCASVLAGALSDGEHTLDVRQVDAAGNAGQAAAFTWDLDRTAPIAPLLVSHPDVVTGTPSVSFSFTGENAIAPAFECRFDGGAWGTCSSPVGYAGLADGQHTFEVRQLDAAGNVGAINTYTFEVDTTAPAAPEVASRPADVTKSVSIAFSAAGTVSCRVDGGAWTVCASPFAPAGLADGAHTVELRTTDAAGNVSPVTTVGFVLDTTAPAPPAITEGPSGATMSHDAAFKVAGEPGGSYECRLDGGAWTACPGEASYPGLADGQHVFDVRQIDAAGNVSAARSSAFVIGQPSVDEPHADHPHEDQPHAEHSNAVQAAVATTAAVKPSGGIAVGCRLDHGALKTCEVRAYVMVGGRRVTIGTGRVQQGKAATSSREVTVTLNARGKRLLARALGGLPVVFDTTATPVGAGATPLKATAKSRVFPVRTLVVPNEGLFASGSARLTAKGARYVSAIRRQLRNVKAIRCLGHTDALGMAAANQALGLRRARMVCHVLTAGSSHAPRTTVASAGERQPRASNATRAGRALNRRVELTVSYA